MDQKFKVMASKSLYAGRYIELVEEELELPNGTLITRPVVKHNGAVVILPQDGDGSLLLVKQYRHAPRATLLEFPAGTLEVGEAPAPCAKREIKEEVGYEASEWEDLGILYPAPGFCNEIQYCFFAKGLSPNKEEGDEDEVIEVVRMTVPQVEDAIRKGEMCDAKSLAVFMRARVKGLL